MVKSLPKLEIQDIKEAGIEPVPRAIRVFPMRDSTGEDALQVILVFPNQMSYKDLSWLKIERLVRFVQKRLRANDDADRYVFVKVRRTADLQK